MLVLTAGQSGCIQKAVFPEAHFTVVSVTPDKLFLAKKAETTETGDTGQDPSEEDNVTLPPTTISLNSDTGIPANLVSFSITYTTRLGDPITSMTVPETPLNLQIPASGNISFGMNPYTGRLFRLLELTRADISPINAKMVFTIKDVNGNKMQVEAHCLCYARWDEYDPGA